MHNTALYLAVKKAFTPFAALHTLKQIQVAQVNKYNLIERSPLQHYTI